MKKYFLLLFLLTWGIAPLLATDPVNTRMLSQPATSATQIAFIYAEDLWVADINGANPRRITVDEGVESNPVFSPDGKMIAFNAEYDGNVDVFIVPAQGGVPVRLTWHPGNDQVRGFTPNGQSVLFISQREVFTTRYQQLFTVPVNGGMPVKLEIPNAFWAAYSPDGKQLVYTPLADAFKQWKNYRGGTHSVLWVYSFADKSTYKIPQPEGGCNDVNPVWLGNTIYFRSDRNGEFNLFSYHTGTKKLEQLTTYNDFPVLYINGAGEKIILEQAGYLHQYTPGSTQARKLTIGIAADLLELRPRFVKGAKYIRSAALSPSGARAVFDFRGDIVTVPAEKGDHRNITATTGAHEKFPAWSADGRSIAYFSDATGEYQLVIQQQDGKGEPRRYALNGSGFYAHASWSPDGRKISYTDNARNLYVLDVASGSSTKIASDDVYTLGAFRNMANDWSHDSKWLAYTRVLETQFRQVFLYSVEQQRSFPLTDGLSDAVDPVFDRNGRYLYFLASTDAGPVINWFNQSNSDHRETFSIYAVTLQKETASPFPRENDEEQMITEADSTKTPARKKPGALVIHWEGIQNRIVDVPLKPGIYSRLSMGKEDELLFLSGTHETPTNRTLCKYDVSKRKFTELAEADSYTLSANGKKMLYAKGQTWTIANSGEKPEAGKGVLNLADVDIYIEPRAEWANMLDEVWRINRDYFYDPGMHGANWPAMKKKYEVFLPHLSTRSDLNTLIQWMCSELGVGHHRLTNDGDPLNNPQKLSGGLLGADYTVDNNRFRIKKIYGGLNWNPGLRSPLTEPGVHVREGDYLLAVNGKELTAKDNLYRFFENTSGRTVELTVGPNAGFTGSRTVKVVPVNNENALRNRDWVEGNLAKVNKATNNQVAYVYVPNTARGGFEYFKRYFYPQANKKAVIIDERFNGGGQVADYYITLLQQPYQAHWNMRYGKDLKTPMASIQGPKVMIIDETAGSGGDMLPWMFRKFNVGKLVGKRTWGGLVGIIGFPELLDGGSVTAPNLAIWTKDGFIVENVGVAPDVEVEQTPAEIMNGRDPQLEKAIELVLKELENNPQTEPVRPPYPKRVRNR